MNAHVASKRNPGGRAFRYGAKAAWIVSRLTDGTRHSGGVTATARWQGCAEQLEKPSSPRREIGGEGNRITGDTGKSGTGERVTEGSVVAEKQSNVCGAKGPCCL
jgi:hypothetical protein